MKGNTKSFDHISHTLSQDETAYIIYKQLAFRYNIQKKPPTGVPRKSCSEKCSKFTGEHLCRSVISIKLQSNFIDILLQHEFSPVNLLHIFRTPFLKNTSGRLLLNHRMFLLNLYIDVDSYHLYLNHGILFLRISEVVEVPSLPCNINYIYWLCMM